MKPLLLRRNNYTGEKLAYLHFNVSRLLHISELHVEDNSISRYVDTHTQHRQQIGKTYRLNLVYLVQLLHQNVVFGRYDGDLVIKRPKISLKTCVKRQLCG